MKYLMLLTLFWGMQGFARAQDFYIAAPSTLRLNSEENFAIAIDGEAGAQVNVYVQDHPSRIRNVSQKVLAVQPGVPVVSSLRLDSADFPPGFLSGSLPHRVALIAVVGGRQKEILIPVSGQAGYVFIQTDKPIYTPRQTANIRIVSLTEEALPSSEKYVLQIRNPDNIIVEEKAFNENRNRKLDKIFGSHTFTFPSYPAVGEWAATVQYGHNLEQNSTVRFQLQEYVLPTFTVELKTPDVILPNHEIIEVQVEAKHVYGKRVKGVVSFRLGVKSDLRPDAVFFAVIPPRELEGGEYALRVRTDGLKQHKDIGWFPLIDGSRLVVEATVLDFATGNRELATDATALFSKSPFHVSFKRSLSDFKPGLNSFFVADLTYVDGRPASGVSTRITAVADDGSALHGARTSVRSDEEGRVAFEVQPEIHHKSVKLTLETDDPRYEGVQASGSFEQFAYQAAGNAYIAIARSSLLRLKPGDKFGREIHFEPAGIQNIYYLVLARGKILEMGKLKTGAFKVQALDIPVTHEMVPSFRLVVFAHHGKELLADSLKIDVDRVCKPEAQVKVEAQFNEREPGSNGKIVIEGTKGTAVGLLGIDEAVYALSKKDLLTAHKVFERLESHDLGCGPGGGVNVNMVLGNAGVTVATHHFTPSHAHSCVEIKRRKREAAKEITLRYSARDRECCSLGLIEDKAGRTCEERAAIVERLDAIYANCSRIYTHCCRTGKQLGITDLKIMRTAMHLGRSRGEGSSDEVEFIEADLEEDFERQTTVRKDFRETWIWENVIVGPDGREELGLSLPHSITTWVVQAVSVSRWGGVCVAEPRKLVSFKKLFLHLNLPYSVVRNEQVEVQATVFNYGDKDVGAVVYMYGAKDLCSGTQPGQKSGRKRLVVKAQSAATVAFPVIPLKAQDFPVKVTVLSPAGSDVIEKTLHVIPEGVPKEIHIPIKLDPTNQQRRQRRHVETELYSDHIDFFQNLQVTAVKLSAPEGFVPDTASCSISALGDAFGPVVSTAINNPEGLLRRPHGCGEQNMMFLAPTLYTMRYLKVTGKLTADSEAKGYEFIRHGYAHQLTFRKEDGSFAAYQSKPTSHWLTAFVMKVFCQATELVNIDKKVICSGVKWLVQNQEPDGAYVEKNPMYHVDMMGGVQGKPAMTAFALIAMEECTCDEENLLLSKKRAAAFLENHLGEVKTPLVAAVVAYALALADSDMKEVANNKLLSMAETDESNNWLFWRTENSAQDVETAGYALLNQLLFNDMTRSNSIVNWLNTKQLQSGSFKSTQDTVIALQALSEYAIRAQQPSINLVANISSSNDRNFHKVLMFRDDNALVLQDVKIDKIGGNVFINTAGHGMGSLVVKLRYNMMVPTEDVCKFDISVNVTDAVEKEEERRPDWEAVMNPRGKDMFDMFPEDLIRGIKKELAEEPPVLDGDPRSRAPQNKASLAAAAPFMEMDKKRRIRMRRQNPEENSKVKLNIALCVKYLGNKDAEMSIVDVGIFSGFEPVIAELKKLESDPGHLIQRFEQSSRGVVFYLQRVPIDKQYCFSFDVIRQYLVGNTAMSVIKVYDYYNPDAACTKFYSPGSNSPLLRTICEGGICECAEGGCPPHKPFPQIVALPTPVERRDALKTILCENYDYVWKGKLNGRIVKEGGFLNISFVVEEVVKAGIEKAADIEGESRTLLARDNCRDAHLFAGATYLVLGRDGQAYQNPQKQTWYRYLLDKTSGIHLWTLPKESQDPRLQRDLNYVTRNLKEKGCEL